MDKKALKLLHTGNAAAFDNYLRELSREEKDELLSAIFVHGDSIAHFAAREHKLEILKVLAKHQCSFEISNDNGQLLQYLPLRRRPLHEAIDSQLCVEFLVSICKVDINAMKRGDWTALMIAVSFWNKAMKGIDDTVKFLIKAGARVDMINRDGWNALHLAVKEGKFLSFARYTELAKYLVDIHPQATMVISKSGRLSVQTAARCNADPSLTLYLLKNSSSPPEAILNHQDNSGQTLLQDAVAAKNIDLVRVLLEEYKADANVPDKLGRTAVHHAAMIGSLAILTVFHELHDSQKTVIQWDIPDSWDQWTPLMHAAREGNMDCAAYLIKCCHCDASKKDKQGRTAHEIGELDRKTWWTDCIF
ncbi:hypothetical protein INT43_004295 [Umbelopsis isabellina]|uniref:Ankyrin repeat protein n=1 Tax=Mortierella isabellina TaxID=91625 RepID=A0A8H7PHU2_MORIS|nr:hypothetical protein INT43_004295 [Umbelopsis isabellina]